MRVLVIGSGAREHALCLAICRDPVVTALACAPGNPGVGGVAEQLNVSGSDPQAVAALATQWAADLVVVGPEAPLVNGVTDAVRAVGIACFGPTLDAARIEGSKSFAKDVMSAAGVPTAAGEVVDDPAELEAALARFGPTWVVKDDSLAGGKGVVVTADVSEARAHARTLLAAGRPALLESYLDGPEASLFCLVDGRTVRPLLPAQDFKRVGDEDLGPNTGGMGAYAPLPWAPEDLAEEVATTIVQPVADELAARGTPFSGLLYAGLALTSDGPKVIEFNCRFGDPETQVVLPLLHTPLASLLYAVATGGLAAHPALEWRQGAAVTVVLAAAGYPDVPRDGEVIVGADSDGVLHGGTRRREDGALVSQGGRVLSVVDVGTDLAEARERVYEAVARVNLPGGHHRADIALRAARGEIVVPGVAR